MKRENYILPAVEHIVLMRDTRYGNTWLASDDDAHHPLQHMDIRNSLLSYKTEGVCGHITWRAINASDIVTLRIHPDVGADVEPFTISLIKSIGIIDDRYGEARLGSDCDDCVWSTITRMIGAGEIEGYISYRAASWTGVIETRDMHWKLM